MAKGGNVGAALLGGGSGGGVLMVILAPPVLDLVVAGVDAAAVANDVVSCDAGCVVGCGSGNDDETLDTVSSSAMVSDGPSVLESNTISVVRVIGTAGSVDDPGRPGLAGGAVVPYRWEWQLLNVALVACSSPAV